MKDKIKCCACSAYLNEHESITITVRDLHTNRHHSYITCHNCGKEATP